MATRSRIRLAKTTLTALALLAVAGLLLPAYGPMLDPGYAESVPGHGHVQTIGAEPTSAEHTDGTVPTPGADVAVTGMVMAVIALGLLAIPSVFTRLPAWVRRAPAPLMARVTVPPPRSFA